MTSQILIQITDTHLYSNPDEIYRGWKTNQSLQAVLDLIRSQEHQIDALLATGDLVHDESLDGYRRLHGYLNTFNTPVLAIAGNHDNPDIIAGVFATPRQYRLGNWQCWLLNSHQPGQLSGHIDENQLKHLSSGLAEDSSPALIAVHHPPVAIGTAWLDRIGLDNSDALWNILRPFPQVKIILSGHVHQGCQKANHGTTVITTPSTCRQFTPGCDTFSEDRSRTPGYRRLALHSNGKFDTRIQRLDTWQIKV